MEPTKIRLQFVLDLAREWDRAGRNLASFIKVLEAALERDQAEQDYYAED